jgi:hypothetical protein
LNYTLSGTETNALPSVSSPTAFNLKTIDRTGNGDLYWIFNARELLPNFSPVRSLSIDNSYRLESGDTYENVEKEFKDWQKITLLQLKRVQRKNGGSLYGLIGSLDPQNPAARRRQLTLRNTLRSSGNWSPLDWLNPPGMLQPLKTLSMTATVTSTEEHTETTETERDAITLIWPDLIFSLRDTERLYGLQRWMGNSQLNVRSNVKKTETYTVELTENKSVSTDYRFTLWGRYDFFLTYGRSSSLNLDLRTRLLKSEGDSVNHSYQVGMKFGSWRLTPSASFRADAANDGSGKATQDLAVQTYSLVSRFDKAYPNGFRFPFSKKVFGNINRLIVDSKLNFERKQSGLNFERDNTDITSLDLTGEYEISRNFRLSFGGGGSFTKNRAKKEDSLWSININSQLVIQF